ncbi:MAG: DinB family protein [Nannocystaceae bacterium]
MNAKSLSTNPWVRRVHQHKSAFHRTMDCFDESHSTYRPAPGMLTAADQVLHVLNSNEYMLSGLFGPFDGIGPASRWQRGFGDLSWLRYANTGDFEAHLPTSPALAEARSSLGKALELLDQSLFITALVLESKGPDELTAPLLENPLFPVDGLTSEDLLESMFDHVAHHRGALSQYARLLGLDPKLPYYDLQESQHEMLMSAAATTG